MRIIQFSLIALAGIALAGCEGTGAKETGGTLVGAGAGALIGSQIGGGSGRLAATAVGTLVGAFLGREAGRSLDRADMAYAQRAQQGAQAAPIGETITWSNPQSGHSGTITPTREGTAASGAYCREFQQTIVIGGKTEAAFGTACRQPDGSWRVLQ